MAKKEEFIVNSSFEQNGEEYSYIPRHSFMTTKIVHEYICKKAINFRWFGSVNTWYF